MNEVDAELGSVPAHRSAYVVTELIFHLVADDGERRDGGHKLVVAVGFESRDGLGGGAERKCQRKSKVSITHRGAVEIAGAKSERSHRSEERRVGKECGSR